MTVLKTEEYWKKEEVLRYGEKRMTIGKMKMKLKKKEEEEQEE